jgi:hypothetical protein
VEVVWRVFMLRGSFSPKEDRVIYQETRDNGWIKVRRNLVCHVQDGRMGLFREFAVFDMLLLLADSATGEVLTSSNAFLTLFHCGNMSERTMRKIFSNLEDRGYIRCMIAPGQHGLHRVLINKYPISTGDNAGKLSQIPPKNGVQKSLQKGQKRGKQAGELEGDQAGELEGERVNKHVGTHKGEQVGEHVTGASHAESNAYVTQPILAGKHEGEHRSEQAGEQVGEQSGELAGKPEGEHVPPIQERDRRTEKEKDKEGLPGTGQATRDSISLPAKAKAASVTGSKSTHDYELLSPARKLAWEYLVLMDEPRKYSTSTVQEQWGQHFALLLANHAFDKIQGTMHYAWKEPNFWQDKVYREKGDPVEYFVSKYQQIEDLYLPWKHKQILASQPSSINGKAPEVFTALTFTPAAELAAKAKIFMAEEEARLIRVKAEVEADLERGREVRRRMMAARNQQIELEKEAV